MQTNIGINMQDSASGSFIEEARQAQIIEATVMVLAEYGYTNTSFAHIAGRAGISTSLIRYYFKTKDNLMRRVFEALQKKACSTRRGSIAICENTYR